MVAGSAHTRFYLGASALLLSSGCQIVSGLDNLDAVGYDSGVLPISGHHKDAATDEPKHDALSADADSTKPETSVDDARTDHASDAKAPKTDGSHADTGTSCGPLDTTENCGACGVTCDSESDISTACNGSTCTYVCKVGFSNCNMTPPDQDGCECATPGCCGTGCETTHNNGAGDNYFDCESLGTLSESQAMAACTAFTTKAGDCSDYSCGSSSSVCSVGSSTSCVCWSYAGPNAGHVYSSGSPGLLNCACPGAGTPTWD